jgi:hypothetical protein
MHLCVFIQVAFTVKELRELVHIQHAHPVLSHQDFAFTNVRITSHNKIAITYDGMSAGACLAVFLFVRMCVCIYAQ